MKKNKGFTLVELMVVISIIAILTGIITTNLTKSRSKARDAKRVSDVSQLQLALELVFDRCNKYPLSYFPPGNSQYPTIKTDTVCTKNGTPININTFITVVPSNQPIDSGDVNYYRYAASPPNQTDYRLGTRLENTNEVLTDDIDSNFYGLNCADSASSLVYCVGPQ